MKDLRTITEELLAEELLIRKGGNAERQKRLGRLTARERLEKLLDDVKEFFEIGLWAGFKMYPEELPAAGVIAGIGTVAGRSCMIIANDATVKAGAMFPQSVKKMLRAQRIAYECRLPILYLVDSSGVFLPLQDEIFPDEDDFGRIFRNNSILSANGIPQFAAIMGNCIAGGGYLPVLCDKLLMTEGSGLYIAGPALVQSAIGQIAETEELGGAKMHAALSGTVDFYEPDDLSCLKRLRELVSFLPADPNYTEQSQVSDVYEMEKEYDMRDLVRAVVDQESFQEYKELYAKTIITGYARIGGMSVGIVGNQKIRTTTARGEVEIGGVLYPDSADKAARFILDCNQMGIPIVFFQDVVGFMVGREAEQAGIIRHGAKLVNVISNSVVPKITVVVGNSFGAGNYALCGKAYDPNFILAWPNAKYAVMGADQAADTLFRGKDQTGKEALKERYNEQMDIRYGAARGWIDAIIAPHTTRAVLIHLLRMTLRKPLDAKKHFHTGVLQT